MPDVETIMEQWMDGGDQKSRDMPDFENADLLTLVDEVCGECIDIIFKTTMKIISILKCDEIPKS